MGDIVEIVLNGVSGFLTSVTKIADVLKLVFAFLPSETLGILFTGFGFLAFVCIYKGVRG